MNVDYETDYRMRWMDFDRFGRIRPGAVLDIFQDIATVQAELAGMGRDDLIDRGVFWVITRMRYEVVNEPRHHERVISRTWPHSPTRLSFLRDYTLSSEEGDLLVKATSEWVLMDAVNRTFASVLDHLDPDMPFREERTFPAKPKKLKVFDETGIEPYLVTPSFVDVDLNGHVNNARYADYILDALAPYGPRVIRGFQIDYRHEVAPDQELSIYSRAEDGRLLAKGMAPDGTISFMCALDVS